MKFPAAHPAPIAALSVAMALAIALQMGLTVSLFSQEDFDPGDAPDFIPAPPTQTTVKKFPANSQSPVLIPSHDGRSMVLALPTSGFRNYQVQVSPDLSNWSPFSRGDATSGNDSIRTFIVDLAMEMALFARVAWF